MLKCIYPTYAQGSNDLQLERMNVYFNEASGGEAFADIQNACPAVCTRGRLRRLCHAGTRQ